MYCDLGYILKVVRIDDCALIRMNLMLLPGAYMGERDNYPKG